MRIDRYSSRYIVGLMTRVGLAKKGTKSMKTTIPEAIVEFLELLDKDELEWKMHVEGVNRAVVVQKKSGQSDTLALARFAMQRKKKRD
jgi:hypothetical protein